MVLSQLLNLETLENMSHKHHFFILAFVLVVGLIFGINSILSPDLEQVGAELRGPQIVYANSNMPLKDSLASENRPFAEGNYAYDERTADFRLVCSAPCPVSKNILDQEFSAISYSLATLRGITQTDIHPNSMPFEVHASEDKVCPPHEKGIAYAKKFTDTNGVRRGLLCFFYDEINYDRSKFPYSTSVHEVTHLFQQERFPRYKGSARALREGMAEMMDSFFLKGSRKDSFCWEGNDWFGDVVNNPHDPHGTGRQLFFELCQIYGFDYDDLPEFFERLDAYDRPVTVSEFVSIINSIVGADTTHLFIDAGLEA